MGLDFFESRIIFIPISQPKMKIENPKIVMMSRKIEITCPGERIIVSIPLACAISLPSHSFKRASETPASVRELLAACKIGFNGELIGTISCSRDTLPVWQYGL